MRFGHVTGRQSRRRRRFFGLLFGVSVLVLSMGAGAFASTLSDVVPSSGSVAGRAYPFWLQRAWQFYFEAPAPGPKPCETATVNGQTVTLVEDIGGGNSTCHVPAGHPIYINELSTECSNIPGHHNGWGTSDSELQKCSRTVTERALISEWLDGRRVPNFGKTFWKPVSAFSVNIQPGRFKGFNKRHARAAAWGWALLLRKLPKGKHTVRCKATYPNGKFEFGSRITLHVG